MIELEKKDMDYLKGRLEKNYSCRKSLGSFPQVTYASLLTTL